MRICGWEQLVTFFVLRKQRRIYVAIEVKWGYNKVPELIVGKLQCKSKWKLICRLLGIIFPFIIMDLILYFFIIGFSRS